MAHFFSHYWSEKTFLRLKKDADTKLDHTAGNQFVKHGVQRGDGIYIWSRVAGRLFLVGTIRVGRIATAQEAQAYFSQDTLWDAEDHVLAMSGTAMLCRFDLEIPTGTVQELRLLRSNGPQPPVFNEAGVLHQQALRGVIELTAETAKLLDDLIAKPSDKRQKVEDTVDSLSKTQEEKGSPEGIFNPMDIEDERQRSLALVVMQRGQAKFRQQLLQAYDSKCAITECDAVEALEAAHIVSYQGSQTNQISNGLLLRADIHTLFDLGLLAIDTSNMSVILHSSLISSCYKHLIGKTLAATRTKTSGPYKKALDQHRFASGL